MNKATLIGNLCADPVLRSTQAGIQVCSFTIAVNRKVKAEAGQPEADFFRVTAWRQLADICAKYLSKGKKVCVIGPVALHEYTKDGVTKASLEVTADDVEFLSPREQPTQAQQDEQLGFTKIVGADEDLPF